MGQLLAGIISPGPSQTHVESVTVGLQHLLEQTAAVLMPDGHVVSSTGA